MLHNFKNEIISVAECRPKAHASSSRKADTWYRIPQSGGRRLYLSNNETANAFDTSATNTIHLTRLLDLKPVFRGRNAAVPTFLVLASCNKVDDMYVRACYYSKVRCS